jgi:hypothetical protein
MKPWDLLLRIIDRMEKEVITAVMCVGETSECNAHTSTIYLASKNNLMNTR